MGGVGGSNEEGGGGLGNQGHGDCMYLCVGQLPMINRLLQALVDGSIQQKLLGAAASCRRRRRRLLLRRRRRRRRQDGGGGGGGCDAGGASPSSASSSSSYRSLQGKAIQN